MFETHIIDIYKGGMRYCKIEHLLKGGKTHGPIVLNNNNNKMFLETSTFLAINGIVSHLEASYELGPLSSLPLVSP